MTVTIPEQLRDELVRMRRAPDEFRVLGRGKCKFCGRGQTAIMLGHASNAANAATWCSTHGVLTFDSAGIPPVNQQQSTRKVRKAA